MGLNSEVNAAFNEAAQMLAEIGGMDADAEGNTLIADSVYRGVYGVPQVERTALPGGGYRQRTFVSWTVLRSLFLSPPPANAELVRIDLDPHITYRNEKTLMHDPVHYVLTLIKVGE